MDSTETKRCVRCGVEKPTSDFNRAAANRDGKQSWCKHCVRARARELENERQPAREAQLAERRRERLIAQFWKNVSPYEATDSGCWEWMGRRTEEGYGLAYAGERKMAHRYSWELHFGQIPEGVFVCHRCDNPPCVNPDHLFLGTAADNIHDMLSKGRSPRKGKSHPGSRGERNHNHKLTEDKARTALRLYRAGMKRAAIARLLNVHWSTVHSIVSGRTWSYLTEPSGVSSTQVSTSRGAATKKGRTPGRQSS